MNSFSIHKNIDKFIDSLSREERDKVDYAIEMLEIKEYKIEMPFSRKIEKDLYELRIKSSKNIRIFYTFHENKIALLHIIGKKSQKLVLKDLNTARNRLKWLKH
ncbi:MAG: type II toxin-antitoxin system RelE/ParE family toxin [Candidatus Zambryskibacteria bacterium]|nr:type II toxin-antitoxin system RelE/ParE family toxin [Candidatus Zambryskibacteria bacterium]